jgi:hypothetical protein
MVNFNALFRLVQLSTTLNLADTTRRFTLSSCLQYLIHRKRFHIKFSYVNVFHLHT